MPGEPCRDERPRGAGPRHRGSLTLRAQQRRGLKLERYEFFGVQEYWMVDPARQAARMHRRMSERLQAVSELTAMGGDILTSPLFPGLEIPLAEIFL